MSDNKPAASGALVPEAELDMKSEKPAESPLAKLAPKSEETVKLQAVAVPSTSRGYYSTIPPNVQLYNNLQPVRPIRVGNRRAHARPHRKLEYAMKYAEAAGLDPKRLEEIFKLEEANVLVAIAIEHYAHTVTGIADQLEKQIQEMQRNANVNREENVAEPIPVNSRDVEMVRAPPIISNPTSDMNLVMDVDDEMEPSAGPSSGNN